MLDIVALAVLLADSCRNRQQFRARLLDAHAGLDSCDGAGPVRPAVVHHLRVHVYRRPDVRRRGVIEPLRHHADHRVRLIVEVERLAQRRALPAEVPLPKAIAQDGDMVLPRRVFACGKSPPHQRRNAQRAEEIGLRLAHRRRFRLAFAAGVQALRISDQAHRSEALALCLPVEIICAIEREIPRRVLCLPQRHELCGIFKWQRLEQHGIDHGENRRVRANSQRQRQHRNRRESRRLR